MRGSLGADRRRKALVLALMGMLGAIVVYAVSSAAPAIPVPDPIVIVHTESGGVVRDTPVPIGGVPVPIDVDNGNLLGILSPDIDVSVGLISVPELPGNILVPNIVVKRDPLAVLRHAPAPPLKINAQVIIWDAGKLNRLATIDYGFETPPGAKIPPIVTATLTGPVTSGFVDPLKAKISTPGYNGPLKFNIKATTPTLQATFGLKFDPLPEAIAIDEDPRSDGLDFTYDHSGPASDVKLDATGDLKDLASGRVRHMGAVIERLPNHIQLSNTNTDTATSFEYFSGSDLGKPDIEATYRDTLGNGTIVNDVDAKIAGLPSHITGVIGMRPNPATGASDIDSVNFNALDGGQIDAVDFVARNYIGDPGNVPQYNLGPEQFVSMASRRQTNGSTLFRAAGRLIGVRGGSFKRTGPNHDKLDVTTDVGGGTLPLRGIIDLDNRGAPASDSPKRMFVDSTISPLPSNIHVFLEPSGTTDPLHVAYDSSAPVDVDTNVVLATGPANGCGQDRVLCATASIDKLPPHLDISLPGSKGTDFSVSNNSTGILHPDVRATVDVGPDLTASPPSSRTWAKVALLRVPNEVRGRLDAAGGALRAAEFHACAYNFTTASCPPGSTDAIGAVDFTVRDQPSRAGLPPRPDTAPEYVTLVSRHKAPGAKRFEVAGHVDEVRNVAFHQLDRHPGDATTDGVLGALVDIGNGGAFDLKVDTLDDAFDNATTPNIIGDDISKVSVHVDKLPQRFSACVRSTSEKAFDPSGLPADALLAPCETTSTGVQTDSGEPAVTPLTADYTATNSDGTTPADADRPVVTADVTSTKPDTGDLDALNNPFPTTSQLHLVITKVPSNIHADVIPPVTPDPAATPPVAGRKLKLNYTASGEINSIDFGLQARRVTSICGDPRPSRKSLCLSGTLKNLPAKDPSTGLSVTSLYDPDDTKGDIDFTSAPSPDKLSIDGLHLAKVSPGDTPLVLDADIDGFTNHLHGNIESRVLGGEGLSATSNPALPLTLQDQINTCSDGIDNDHDNVSPPPSGVPVDNNIDAKDPDCAKQPARLSFNACPDETDQNPCQGIDHITFTASNSLIGDPLAPVAPDNTLGTDHGEFSFIKKGDDFRAKGDVHHFKRLSYSKLDASDAATPVTSLSTAFGNDANGHTLPLRAVVDADSGTSSQKLEAVITNAPQAIDICMRDAAELADLKAADDSTADGAFCNRAKADGDDATDEAKSAIEIATTTTGVKPTIDLRSFAITKGGGAEVVAGNVKILNLAQRIDMLMGNGSATDVRIEGHNHGDNRTAAVQNVADRITFNVRTFLDDTGLNTFPWKSLDDSTPSFPGFPVGLAGDINPSDDPANDDPTPDDPQDPNPSFGRNYLQVFKNYDGRVLAQGSVPGIKLVSISPHPCNTGANDPDHRFPTGVKPDDPNGYAPADLPDYKCVQASIAPGRRLGLAVRTLDAPTGTAPNILQDALSLEQGHISAMPDSLSATIAKAPDSIKGFPKCGPKPGGGTQLPPCVPPMISVEAPHAPGTPAGVLDVKLATGPRSLISALRGAVPEDTLSARTPYEQLPSTWTLANGDPAYGARVKVGTDDDGNAALRVGLRIKLPRFLDMDPFENFDCATLDPSQTSDCDNPQVGKAFNKGYESNDIDFRMVAADDHHFGNPAPGDPYLGRVALLIDPLNTKTDKQQIVLAGMPDPDNTSPVKHETIQGASSKYDDDFPAAGDDSELGFLAPAHLDTQVFLRNDFTASSSDGGKNQQDYSQIDGRVNAPLSMALRLIDRLPPPGPFGFNYLSSANRDDKAVPAVQLTLRNAASSNNQDNYDKPTFRIRSQLAFPFQNKDKSFGDKALDFFTCGDVGLGIIYFGGVKDLAQACFVLPLNSQVRYLDVQLNGDPNGRNPGDISGNPLPQPWTTPGAARTVDAVGGPFGASNDLEVRGWQQVNDTGGDPGENKGAPAAVTPVAALRLTNFEVGLQASAGIGLIGATASYGETGDLILGTAGDQTSRFRVSHNKMAAELSTDGGVGQVATDLQAALHVKISVDVLFGLGSVDLLNLSIGHFSQDVDFHSCNGNASWPDNEFWTGQDRLIQASPPLYDSTREAGDRKVGMNLGLDSVGGLLIEPIAILTNLVPSCTFFSTHTNPIVTADAPAPDYPTEDHLVPDVPVVAPSSNSVPDPTTGQAPDLPDLNVPHTTPTETVKTLCGTYEFGDVQIDGILAAGQPGAVDENGHACDGSLTFSAHNVTVSSTGHIEADGLIAGGPGQPSSGLGGGAGHAGSGGVSGRPAGGAGGGTYDEPVAGPHGNDPVGGPQGDFGSEGKDGTVAAGKGGGTIFITATDSFHNDGTISADGEGGGSAATTLTPPATPPCTTGGGGGSGGAVSVSTNLIEGNGTISANGGGGGVGGWGGGGGGGGRITTNLVGNDNSLDANGGGAAFVFPGSHCDPPTNNVLRAGGHGGNDGDNGKGTHLARISKVELSDDNPGPFTDGNPTLNLTAITSGGGPLEIVLCRRDLPFTTPSVFTDPGLDPPAGATSTQDWRDDGDCHSGETYAFSGPTDGDHTYKVKTPDLALPTAVYGFFVYARKPDCVIGSYNASTRTCFSGTTSFPPSYEDQEILPTKAGAILAVDHESPSVDPKILSKDGDCIDGSICLRQPTGQLETNANDVSPSGVVGSGVDSVTCHDHNTFVFQDGPYVDCALEPTTFTLQPGMNIIDSIAHDRAGNTQPDQGDPDHIIVKWFVDNVIPQQPTITVTPQSGDTVNNGWLHQRPDVLVQADDIAPYSGWDTDPITLHVDEADVKCGIGGAGNFNSSTACLPAELAAKDPPILSQGDHTLSATSTDRAGNQSPPSDSVHVKIDTIAPTSRLFVGPQKPDGLNGWYVTQPFIAFAATDTPGGSGVDPSKDADHVGSGIFFSVDGRPFQLYKPDVDGQPSTNLLGDGVHHICWYSRDLAGNREDADGDPNNGTQDNCTTTNPTPGAIQDVKVDSTSPTVAEPIVPAAPDGNNSYYVHKPTVTPGVTDVVGPDPDRLPSHLANQTSGIMKTEYQIDDGTWTPAAPIVVAEGEHTIRTRAFDNAGNQADLVERTVRVDISKPTGAVESYPPNPNAQGWFRQNRIDAVAVRDGRDSSGADGATYKIDSGGPVSYLTPFSVEQGVHSVTVTPRDLAGLNGDPINQSSNVDTTPPVATPSETAPGPILISILGIYPTTTLKYTVTDNLAARVKVNVNVFDTLGNLVRRLPINGPFTGGFSATGAGSVVWNGLDDAGHGALPGVYSFRVQAIDQAGNSILSGESPTFLVVQGILPLGLGVLGL